MRHIKPYGQLFENTQVLTQEQKNWLSECSRGIWEINPQTGLVDVRGFFECSGKGISDFKGVRFGNIWKGFYCNDNSLTSLEGAPHKVGGNFYCDRNYITSLKGAPQIVSGVFSCRDNELTSLEGAPRKVVGSNFYVGGNPITEGAINMVLVMMSREGVTLEQAVSKCWPSIGEEDRIYLAKHNPDLPPDEKRGYEALERLKTRVI